MNLLPLKNLMGNKTTRVNINQEECDVYIGRPSIWGNPYTSKTGKTLAKFVVGSKKEAIEKYRVYLLSNVELMERLMELDGLKLGCFCKEEATCHGDILIEQINAKTNGLF